MEKAGSYVSSHVVTWAHHVWSPEDPAAWFAFFDEDGSGYLERQLLEKAAVQKVFFSVLCLILLKRIVHWLPYLKAFYGWMFSFARLLKRHVFSLSFTVHAQKDGVFQSQECPVNLCFATLRRCSPYLWHQLWHWPQVLPAVVPVDAIKLEASHCGKEDHLYS